MSYVSGNPRRLDLTLRGNQGIFRAMAYITAANAAQMARASQAAQKAKKERAAAELLSPAAENEIAEKHRKLRLVRVRKQQERIDDMLLQETDAAKLDRLASAAIRLNEQERQLSGRSLPPTLKANAPTKPKRPAFGLPEPDPEPGDSPGSE